MDAYGALVIILSCFLAFFLMLSIIICVYIIRIIKRVNLLLDKAETAVDQAGKAAKGIAQLVTPATIAKTITNYIKKLAS